MIAYLKTNKYHNKKTIIDGIKFDSKKESNHYITLKLLERAGVIKNLELQKKFELQSSFKFNGKTIRAISYYADFYYYDVKEECYIVEDVKGGQATKTDVYKLKKKLFMNKYRMEIKEI